MNKKMARTNMRMGSALFLVLFLMLGASLLWAALYSNYVTGAV